MKRGKHRTEVTEVTEGELARAFGASFAQGHGGNCTHREAFATRVQDDAGQTRRGILGGRQGGLNARNA